MYVNIDTTTIPWSIEPGVHPYKYPNDKREDNITWIKKRLIDQAPQDNIQYHEDESHAYYYFGFPGVGSKDEITVKFTEYDSNKHAYTKMLVSYECDSEDSIVPTTKYSTDVVISVDDIDDGAVDKYLENGLLSVVFPLYTSDSRGNVPSERIVY